MGFEFTTRVGGYAVAVSKVGRGKLGESYQGAWKAQVSDSDKTVLWETGDKHWQHLHTVTFKTHREVAGLAVAEFIIADGPMYRLALGPRGGVRKESS